VAEDTSDICPACNTPISASDDALIGRSTARQRYHADCLYEYAKEQDRERKRHRVQRGYTLVLPPAICPGCHDILRSQGDSITWWQGKAYHRRCAGDVDPSSQVGEHNPQQQNKRWEYEIRLSQPWDTIDTDPEHIAQCETGTSGGGTAGPLPAGSVESGSQVREHDPEQKNKHLGGQICGHCHAPARTKFFGQNVCWPCFAQLVALTLVLVLFFGGIFIMILIGARDGGSNYDYDEPLPHNWRADR